MITLGYKLQVVNIKLQVVTGSYWGTVGYIWLQGVDPAIG